MCENVMQSLELAGAKRGIMEMSFERDVESRVVNEGMKRHASYFLSNDEYFQADSKKSSVHRRAQTATLHNAEVHDWSACESGARRVR